MTIHRTTLEPRRILAVRERVAMTALTDFFARAFGASAAALESSGLHPAGPPVAVYVGTPGTTVDVAAGFPFTGPLTAPEGTVIVDLPSGDAVEAIHVGPYDELSVTYEAVGRELVDAGLTHTDTMFEEYLTDPDTSPDPGTWRTRIVFPLQ
ncbi:GyrI-like domain-containing protein [Galbitalea soli]|uniref:GyrI-like domain-containing protein n=1 Tax=Galbitalea soli TaxID=1268042 RepID=A0A7C9PMC1_9MICO|nr:GyrI-like domain-containing protein [Galbitalea soli]NEM90870.1 GyrI-like domain-containing protein [Galbitalea soli]NYJ31590.1 effector-binding domain-containing protein [Galbitalea soli]